MGKIINDEIRIVSIFENEEDFKITLDRHEKTTINEVKTKTGYVYWFFCFQCQEYSVFKTDKPFKHVIKADRPKSEIIVKPYRVQIRAMTNTEFVDYVNGEIDNGKKQ